METEGGREGLDGLEDGIIDNFPACTAELVKAKLAAVTCNTAKRNTCLSSAQIAAFEKVFAGARDSKGELLYADWAFDRGLGGKSGDGYYQGWRAWKLGAHDDFERDARKVYAETGIYTKSAWDFMMADATDLGKESEGLDVEVRG